MRPVPGLPAIPRRPVRPFTRAAACVAVAAVGAIPQLGFIHEDSGQSFVLDIADLYRHDVTLDIAFGAVKETQKTGDIIERTTRQRAARVFRQHAVIPSMIDRIKTLVGPKKDTGEADTGQTEHGSADREAAG